MIAQHYKPELADTAYQDVFFSIDGDQFGEDADLAMEVGSRIHEHHEAEAKAQELADRFGQSVDVAVYGTCGLYAVGYIESFLVYPRQDPQAVLARLAA
jgi:hypothetical protein